MRIKKSIVLILVLSMIITTGIITLASDQVQSPKDVDSIEDGLKNVQMIESTRTTTPKKHTNLNVDRIKKEKLATFDSSKSPDGFPPQQGSGSIAYGDTVSGEITEPNIRDQWTFEGSIGDLIVITMDSNDFDTFLDLQQNGESIASNDDYNGLNSQIGPFVLPEDGAYTIIARPLSETATGSYMLALSLAEVQTINYGDTVVGELAANENVSLSFEAEADQVVSIRMSGEDFIPHIDLRDSNGFSIAYDDAYDGGDAIVGPLLIPNDGLYVLNIGGFDISGSAVDYALSLELVEIDTVEGGALSYGDSVTTQIAAAAIHEWTFEGVAGDIALIDISGSAATPDVEVILPNGVSFINSATFGAFGMNQNTHVLPLDGTYIVRVTGNFDDIYTILIEKQGAGSAGTGGGTIAYDETQSAEYGQGSPEIWQFDGEEGDAVTITVESEEFDLSIVMIDSNGQYVDGGGEFGNPIGQLGPFVLNQSDTYYVSVASHDATASGDYSINLTFNGRPEGDIGEIAFDQSQTKVLIGGLNDRWTFEGEVGDVIISSLSSDHFDAYLVLEDADGNELQFNDDTNGLNSQIGPYTLPETGTYTLVAQALGELGNGEYTLTLQRANFIDIAYGDTLSGDLQPAFFHFYQFDATATDIVRITVSDQSFTPTVILSDEAGTIATLRTDYGSDGVIFDWTVPESGQYTLSLTSQDFNSGGEYDISLEVRGRVEVGDGILEYGDTETGLLAAGARDEWIFEGSANDIVTIVLTSEEFDTYLELIEPNGEEVASNDDFQDVNSQIGPIALPIDGTYTIIARGYSTSGSGSYVVSLETSGVAEPGGGELGYGDTAEGFAVGGVQDRWTFEGEIGDIISIKMESDAFDTYLELLDPNETTIAENDDFSGLNSQIGPVSLPESGTYTIITRPLSEGNGGVYTLSLSSTDLEMITMGETSGTLSADATVLYGIEVSASNIVTVSVVSDDFFPMIEIRDSTGESLDLLGDYEESGMVQLTAFATEDTTFLTIFITSTYGDEGGDFTLTIQPIEQVEQAGGVLSYDDRLATNLSTGDTHEWTFSGERGDLIQINMDSLDFDSFLELHDPDGNLIVENDDFNGLNSQIGPLVLPQDGDYTIIARPLSESDSGVYAIALVKQGTGTPGTGGGTISYDESIEGIYSTGTPERWTFEGREGDAVVIRTQAENIIVSLELYDASDNFLAEATNFDYEAYTVELGPIALPRSESYTVVLTSYDQFTTVDYGLSLEFAGRPENGGGDIEIGETVSSTIIGGLQDRWSFEGTAEETIYAFLTDNDYYGVLSLENSDGETVAELNYNYGAGYQVGPYTIPEDGTYHIVVGAEDVFSGGSYDLQLITVEYGEIAYDDTVSGNLNNWVPGFWQFDATETDMVSIELTSENADVYMYMVLLDKAGNVTYSESSGNGSTLNTTLTETDTYTITIFTYDTIVSAPYTLTLTIEGRAEPGAGDGELGYVETDLFSLSDQSETGRKNPLPQAGGGDLEYGDTVTTDLETGARDAWTFEGNLGDVITISMVSDEFDPVLELYDASNVQLARNDDFENSPNARIDAFTLPQSGSYTIIARAYGNSASGEYTIVLSLTSENDDAEADASDTSNANEFVEGDSILLYGETETGEIAAGEEIIFTFEASAGDTVSVLVNSDDFDTWAELRTGQGRLVNYNDNGDGTNSVIIDQELPTNNTYQVIVKSADDDGSGSFTITLLDEAPPINGATDSSPDTETDSMVLTLGEPMTVNLEIETRDLWTFDGESGDIITISMTSPDFDAFLELQAPNGRELTRDDDSGGGTDAFIAPFTLPTSGTYTVVARGFGLEASGEYTILLEESSLDRSGQIAFDEPQSGELLPAAVDEWTFEGQEGDVIQINLDSDEFDPYLELFREDGTFLDSNDDFNGLNSQIGPYTLPVSGTFVIAASGYDETQFGSYQLSLSHVTLIPIAFDQTLEGTLTSSRYDVYQFDAESGDIVVIEFDSRQFDGYLELRATDGFTITSVFGEDNRAQLGPFMLPLDGVYTLNVGATDFSSSGDYSITLRQEVAAVLSGTIDYDLPQTEILVGGADSRWEFEGNAGDTIVITMNSTDFDTFLLLENPDGVQVISNDDYAGSNSQIGPIMLEDDGTYAIVAQSYDQLSSGEYTLTLSQHNLLGEVVAGEIYTQTLETDGVDYWTLPARIDDIFEIVIETEVFTPQIEVRDSQNFLIGSSNEGGEGARVGPIRIAYNDDYTIAIRSADGTGGAYTLHVELRELESDGGSIVFDTVTIAQLDSSDLPRWKFEAQSGTTISITLESEEFDTYLQLLDVDGNEIDFNDDFDGLNSQIGPVVLDRTGTYFIVPQGYNDTDSGVYTLGLYSGSPPENIVGTIAYGDSVLGLLVAGQEDRYTFEGSRGDVITITMSSEIFDTYLALEFSGQAIEYNDDYDDLNSQIGPYTLPSDGIYTIVAVGYDLGASGAYDLTLSLQDGSPFDIEDAQIIAYGDEITETLNGESSVWTFDAIAGDTVTITMSSDEIDSYLELYDSEGIFLESNDDFDGLNAQIGPYEIPADGSYIIVTTSFGNVSGTYTLTLESGEGDDISSLPPIDPPPSSENDDVAIGFEVGNRAPNFTLPSIDGEDITLWDLRGQVVLVNFWATWCEPCREEMPALDSVYQEYQPVGFTIIGVDVEENETLVRGFLTQIPVTFPLVLDDSGDVAGLYGIEFYPTSFLVDEEGIIVRILIGSTNARTLRYELNYIGIERPESDE